MRGYTKVKFLFFRKNILRPFEDETPLVSWHDLGITDQINHLLYASSFLQKKWELNSKYGIYIFEASL